MGREAQGSTVLQQLDMLPAQRTAVVHRSDCTAAGADLPRAASPPHTCVTASGSHSMPTLSQCGCAASCSAVICSGWLSTVAEAATLAGTPCVSVGTPVFMQHIRRSPSSSTWARRMPGPAGLMPAWVHQCCVGGPGEASCRLSSGSSSEGASTGAGCGRTCGRTQQQPLFANTYHQPPCWCSPQRQS